MNKPFSIFFILFILETSYGETIEENSLVQEEGNKVTENAKSEIQFPKMEEQSSRNTNKENKGRTTKRGKSTKRDYSLTEKGIYIYIYKYSDFLQFAFYFAFLPSYQMHRDS